MPETGPPPQHESTRLKYALVGGLTSLPFTTFSYWHTGSELSLGAVVFGGMLAGYLVTRTGGESRGVGIRVGLLGGLPVLWILFDLLAATSGLAGPAWFVTSATVLTVALTLVIALCGFGIAALIGEVGARIGNWLAGNQPGQSAPVVNGEP
ncbi:DUF5518 domain-containing protein [Halorientalis brevis]|uniref:DUF5518 domain-containing protein n=1 Tax=Halorientalis brevis TaxID=1126241 RepID=A0ABD6CID0_9EURY|nr:DUF5518 domain-containing protein [Halorientalis brevis]